MFIKIILSYISGYIRIYLEGYYIERFINICKNNSLLIWNIKRKKDIYLEFNAGTKDFKQICKIAKKTKCKIKITNKNGLPFFLHKHKKRKLFLILLIILLLLIFISSNFIWNIEIIEENNEKIIDIEKDLEEVGVKIGVLKNKVNSKEITNKLRLKRNDLAWVGIEVKGTNAIVKIVKSDEKPEIIDEEEYCNIISDKDGIITKINAQNGTANVKIGDIVKEGDILINGWMEGKYTGVRYVHAKGDIEAKVWYTKSEKILYKNREIEYTNEVENKYAIKINNFMINFNKKLSKFEIYDTIREEKKLKLFSEFYLPISIVKITYREQKEVDKQYSLEQVKEMGINKLQKELDNEIIEKDKIVNKNINTYEKEDGVEVYVTYEVLENIGTNEKIGF